MYSEVEGNIITLALEGKFHVIAHGCNCLSTMGAGLAPQMAKAFGCDKFKMEMSGPDVNKLGCVDYETFGISNGRVWNTRLDENVNKDPEITVVNAYTQYKYGRNRSDGVSRPIDYEALALCMRKMNTVFKGLHIGLPQIGAGLAGGDWNRIKGIIMEELTDCRVTVVIFNGK